MKISVLICAGLGCFVAACTEVATPPITQPDAFISDLPPELIAIADPRQDLSAVRIDPIDGCYVYRYVGPVETTFLPLRTTDNRPICGPAPTPEVAAES